MRLTKILDLFSHSGILCNSLIGPSAGGGGGHSSEVHLTEILLHHMAHEQGVSMETVAKCIGGETF